MGLAADRGARKAPPASFFAVAFQSLPLTREVAKAKLLTEGEKSAKRQNTSNFLSYQPDDERQHEHPGGGGAGNGHERVRQLPQGKRRRGAQRPG